MKADFHRSSFAFIGKRLHITGVMLLDFFMRLAQERPGLYPRPARIVSFKMHQEVRADGYWAIGGSGGSLSRPAASLTYINQGGRTHSAFFVSDGPPIERREAEQPEKILGVVVAEALRCKAELAAGCSFYDFFHGLVEANKAFHVKALIPNASPLTQIRFVYVEDCPVLGFDQRIPDALILAITNKSLNRMQGKVYTLNTVSFFEGRQHDVKICFNYFEK